MNYKIIATGSRGNALAICEGCLTFLIDCGVPYKMVKDLKLDFIFLTHEHADHMRITTIKKALYNCPLCKVVAAPHLYNKLISSGISAKRIFTFGPDAQMIFSKHKTSIVASYFALVHDIPNVGWRLSLETKQATNDKPSDKPSDKSSDSIATLMYATDTSEIDHIEMPDLDYYFLEANYEDDELEARMAEKIRNGEYSYEARVRESHLSKAQADKWLANNAGENSRFIYMHQHIEVTNNEQI